ncbi:DUF6473 family protein [Pseudophaeobacter profundi]|uniref:DUF6473 family protein n=1 Tax=Pseudophaeobacter profundi TaxID=3034152 RepID=UPI00242BB103|nr:DUF6473 family protein [Pseudophaeobacter profundi]
MSYELKSANALAGGTCCYAGSRLPVRGPKRDLTRPYFAFLGGTEMFGRFVKTPFSDVSESLIEVPCVNIAAVNAGLDTFASDAAVLKVARQARVAVVQLMGAQNISNRYYRVHPRRNDRFLQAQPDLKALFPEVDYTEFHFNKHLLTTLQALSEERFDDVRRHLQETWVIKMQKVIEALEGRVLMLWLTYDLQGRSAFSYEPTLVERSMVKALQARTKGLVEVSVTPAGRVDDLEGMQLGELDLPAAQHVLGPKEHARIGCALAEALQGLS